ncbi:MDR family MFS transporter [Pseudorhodoplanes sp.]|uniref:MDR family MFS transporter n=1 Tax=Pseudorhodoplanes sp. TaxID=1934341 RepID=UPI003918A0D8
MTHSPKQPPKAPKRKAKGRSKDTTEVAAAPVGTLSHAEARTVIVGLMLTLFLGALDQTIVATALPTMGRAFGDVENLSWVVTAYLLTATATTPLYGKLSDIYGRRTMMLTAIVIFIAGSVACAMANSMMALILARGLQGLGGGGLMSMTQTIVADIVSPKERGRYQGYIGAVFASSSVGGPVLGGVLTEHLHWSLIFWINLPLGLIAFALTSNVLRRIPLHHRKHALDLPGAAFMMAAAVALLLALTWGGVRFAWLSVPVLGLFAGSILLWTLFAWRLVSATEPFLPLQILANPIVRTATLAGSCCMGVLVGLTIFVPLYFETIIHLSASQSGLALIPLMGASVIGATLAGQLMARVERYKLLAIAGAVLAIFALGAMAIWPVGLPIAVTLSILSVAGFGIGAVFPVTTVSMQNAVSDRHMGIATGALNFFRSLGSALTVALLGAIVLGGIGASGGVSVEALARTASEPALAYAFRFVFLAAMLILCFGLAFLIGMEEKPLRGPAREAPPPDAPATPVQEPPHKD